MWHNKEKTEQIQNVLADWIGSKHPTHLLSVQFPIWKRRRDQEQAQKVFERAMREMQLYLFRKHWRNKHQRFFAVAEHNRIDGWHFHAYLYNCAKSDDELLYALDRVCKNMDLTPETFDLRPITDTPDRVHSYGTKQIKADAEGHTDLICFFTSEMLFDIPASVQNHTRNTEITSNLTQTNQNDQLGPFCNKIYCSLRIAYNRIYYYALITAYYLSMIYWTGAAGAK